MVSRQQVADYVAGQLPGQRAAALRSAAAWLADTGRVRQVEYLARDVAQALAGRGYVYARVTTARPLSGAGRREVEAFIRHATRARELELETAVDPSLVGGAVIETPGAVLDSSVKSALARFVRRAGMA